jgi:hypothetical protein
VILTPPKKLADWYGTILQHGLETTQRLALDGKAELGSSPEVDRPTVGTATRPIWNRFFVDLSDPEN